MENATYAEYQEAFDWENQAKQYPLRGHGVQYFNGMVDIERLVDCLVYYGNDGLLQGNLNYYPFDFPTHQKKPCTTLNIVIFNKENHHPCKALTINSKEYELCMI